MAATRTYQVVGQAVPRLDGQAKVTGAARYVADVPLLQTELLQDPSGPGPYQGKGIGEGPNCPLAAAIANAVEDAVGVRIYGPPTTAEKVRRALQANLRG